MDWETAYKLTQFIPQILLYFHPTSLCGSQLKIDSTEPASCAAAPLSQFLRSRSENELHQCEALQQKWHGAAIKMSVCGPFALWRQELPLHLSLSLCRRSRSKRFSCNSFNAHDIHILCHAVLFSAKRILCNSRVFFFCIAIRDALGGESKRLRNFHDVVVITRECAELPSAAERICTCRHKESLRGIMQIVPSKKRAAAPRDEWVKAGGIIWARTKRHLSG